MKSLDESKYIKEIEKYYINLKGSFCMLTPKEVQLIISWYHQNLDIEVVKNFIKKEIIKFPKNKRKKFSLINVDKKLKERKKLKKEKTSQKDKWEIVVEKLNLPKNLLNIPENFKGDKSLYLEKNIISYVWKNMPKVEKENLVNISLNELKNEIIFNVDKKSVLKSLIYTKIKEDLLSKI